jgi:hypothetical protein
MFFFWDTSPLSVDECRGTLCDLLLCSNCVIFGAFRTTLDVVVVQPFWFEQGMFAVQKLCLFRTECILTIIMGRTCFVYCIKSAIISTIPMYHAF